MPKPTRPAATEQTKYGSRVLRLLPKCEGLDVWELQIKLIGWGSGANPDGVGNAMDPVRVTGTFDTTTRDAVLRFQKAHKLRCTGEVDEPTFLAIDREAALHPVLVHEMKCPCARGENTGDILCRCSDHPYNAVCDGFGSARGDGKFLLEKRVIFDGTSGGSASIQNEKLDLYDMKEYPGMDKALLWGMRAVMHRAQVERLGILAGYRCWRDNYSYTDDRRWRHRRVTWHFGKALEFYHAGKCTDIGKDWKKTECVECNRIRTAAQTLCGFQIRWHEPDRIGVSEAVSGDRNMIRPPVTPYSVHINSVRRVGRENDDFVKTHFDGAQPLYDGALGISYPIDLGAGTDPRTAPSEDFFHNTEYKPGGWFPMGASRQWHTGVHLFADAGKEVYTLAPGQLIACRFAEAVDAKSYGSRNFVLIQHEWNKKPWYSLLMHLDAGAVDANTKVPWRQKLFMRTKDHYEPAAPTPIFEPKVVETKNRLIPVPGLTVAEWREVSSAESDPKTALDDQAPASSLVVKLAPAVGQVGDRYAYTKLEDKIVGKRVAASGDLAGKLGGGQIIALTDPIPVAAGELIGYVGGAATDSQLAPHGTFIHLEVFSPEALLSGAGYETLDISDKHADRQDLVLKLLDKNLVAGSLDKVLLHDDVQADARDPYGPGMRSVILKMKSAWSLDWKSALSSAPSLSFLKEGDVNTLGTNFNDYAWWSQAAAGGKLPGSDVVFHYHPIAFLLAIAFAPPA
jgi:hypothetical protein